MPTIHRLRDVDPVAIALCKKGANGQRIFLKKAEGETAVIARDMPIYKALGDDWRALYCVVAQPDHQENGGMLDPDKVDVWDSPDEIRKAAHRLLKNRGAVNVEHGDVADAHIVESAVALAPIPLDGVTIPEGAWYVAIEPSTELRKAYDDGELTGVSLEGFGTRVEAEEMELTPVQKRSIWKALGESLGLTSHQSDSGTLDNDRTKETDVAEKNIAELEGKVEEIAKAQGAATTAIERLADTVNGLVERLDKKNQKEEGEEKDTPTAESIKKSVDDLATTVAERLDTIDAAVDKLAEGGSSQGGEGDTQIKKSDRDPLAGIL